MTSGYSQARRCKEAGANANIDPSEATIVSVRSTCAVLGALETGKWVDSYIKKRRMTLTVTLGTELMDFYAKCGSIDNAIEVFKMMPSKIIVSWTVLIKVLLVMDKEKGL